MAHLGSNHLFSSFSVEVVFGIVCFCSTSSYYWISCWLSGRCLTAIGTSPFSPGTHCYPVPTHTCVRLPQSSVNFHLHLNNISSFQPLLTSTYQHLNHALIIMPSSIPQTLWNARIPLSITHSASPTNPFIVSVPRFSYLALLLPRLSAFFGTPCSSFHFEDVQLRNLAVGLLVDLYQPSLPWRLTVNDGVGWDISDTFLNSAKEVSSFVFPLLCYFIRLCLFYYK